VEDARVDRGREVPADVAPHAIERLLKHGVFWSLAGEWAQQIIRFVGAVVLARLLSPSDYGLAAAAVVLASYSMLGDLGFGTAFVQAAKVTNRIASTAFWSALAAGVSVSVFVAVAAYPIARLLGDSAAGPLIVACSTTFLLFALGSTSRGFLTRALNFRMIQGSAAIAWLVASTSAIIAAVAGVGAWALVVQQVAVVGATTAVILIAVAWRPQLEFDGAACASLARFAFPSTGGAAFMLARGIVITVLVGHSLGVEALGIWSFAMATVIVPLWAIAGPVGRLLYATFARLQGQPDRVGALWLYGVGLLAAVLLPALFGLLAVAPDLIPTVFGSQWTDAVVVVQILILAAAFNTVQAWSIAITDAAGKPHVALVFNAIGVAINVVSVWIGSNWGIEGVAVAYVAGYLLFSEIPMFIVMLREMSISPADVFMRLYGVVLASLVMCAVAWLTRLGLEDAGAGPVARLVITSLTGVVVYAGALFLFARSVFGEISRVARRRKTPAVATP
jgi:PST family polysaccharide transporter